MGKRAANTVAARTTAKKAKAEPSPTKVADVKKSESNPILASIAEGITQADLPQKCRDMLIELIPFTIKFPSDERHEMQSVVVDMVQKTLSSKKECLEASIQSEEQKLANLRQTDVAAAVPVAESALDAQKSVVNDKVQLLAEATASATVSGKALADRLTAQKASSDKLMSLQAEKAALESAFQEHFSAIKEGECGEHFKGLEPFLKSLEVDSSLLISLPSCCEKTKEQRQAFDVIILEEFEKAFTSKIAALAQAVASAIPASEECETATRAAQKEHDAKEDIQKQAAAEVETAQIEQTDREEVLKKAKEAVDNLQPLMEAISTTIERVKMELEAFKSGPLASFVTYNAMGTAAETASAGA